LLWDDPVLLSDSEDDLQKAISQNYKTTKQFGMKISPLKSNVTTFKTNV
jgi:hypothetical protein